MFKKVFYVQYVEFERNEIGEMKYPSTVTSKCVTKLGAKFELMKWKREHIPDEFEI